MSGWFSYFTGRKNVKEGARDSIINLRQSLLTLEKKEEYLNKQIEDDLKKARANATTNKQGEYDLAIALLPPPGDVPLLRHRQRRRRWSLRRSHELSRCTISCATLLGHIADNSRHACSPTEEAARGPARQAGGHATDARDSGMCYQL